MPTYNERENLEAMAGRVRAAVPDADLLVVDDNSPDGTGELADKLAAEDSHVRVLHRPGKGGLGAAYIAGFRWALDQGYGAMVEMDADGSHQPEQLPDLLAALEDADLVLGSRWVPGGRTVNWPKSRQLISRGGSFYSRLMLRITLRDATAATGPTGRARCAPSGWMTSTPRATASRSTWPGARSVPGCGWWKCRSRSSSASRAPAR